jgi:hypothetical protein
MAQKRGISVVRGGSGLPGAFPVQSCGPMPSAEELSTKRRPAKMLLRRILVSLVVLFLLIYTGDFFWFHTRTWYPAAGLAVGSVHRTRMLAIPQKNGKVDYEMDTAKPEEDVPCVHSLFPHWNQNPCWYVVRHANDPISM